MTDSDSSTDPEDFEYIPEGDVGRSDSEASVDGEEEEQRGVTRSGKKPTARRKRKSASNTRKHRGGIKLHVEDEEDTPRDGGGDVSGESEGEVGEVGEKEEEERQMKEKARVDDLWASFKQDTMSRDKQDTVSNITIDCGNLTSSITSKQQKPKDEPKMVKIKKTYDFAGDKVVVEKEVAADSKEARQFVQTPQTSTSSTSSLPSSGTGESAITMSTTILTRGKRSGLSSVLQSLSKKPKMSTLEKSQLDWNKFKADEGLEHELSQQRKDGYLERQEFLRRTDQRQYELEREERLKKYRRLN